jgi:hypothetical protein
MKGIDTMKMRRIAVTAAAALFSMTVLAHHSFALYDQAKLTALSGTVHDWAWANPHCWLVIDLTKADGKTEQWALAGSSPNMMSRWGWNAADIKVGDKIQVDAHPAKDGSHFAQLRTVFLANGKVLVDPAGQSGEALATGPTSVPTKPQGVPYR